MPRTGLCRAYWRRRRFPPNRCSLPRHSFSPSNFGKRESMRPNCETPWTLAREPEGPLADHLDTFARRLYEQGFKRRVIGVHVRTAARFSRWLQAEHVAAE